jgi:hypothetical protein
MLPFAKALDEPCAALRTAAARHVQLVVHAYNFALYEIYNLARYVA